MVNYSIIIFNFIITISVSIITVKLYLHFNINKIINNQNNVNIQNNASQIVNNYLNEELSSDKINAMINIKIEEALKNRPRVLTYKNKEEMIANGADIKDSDIVITLED